MHPDCLIREVNYFICDILIFSWKFQTASLSGKENFLKHHYSPGGGKKKKFSKVVKLTSSFIHTFGSIFTVLPVI